MKLFAVFALCYRSVRWTYQLSLQIFQEPLSLCTYLNMEVSGISKAVDSNCPTATRVNRANSNLVIKTLMVTLILHLTAFLYVSYNSV